MEKIAQTNPCYLLAVGGGVEPPTMQLALVQMKVVNPSRD
jgi:hypothetical protein